MRTSKRPEFAGPDHRSGEAFIRSFCQDYKTWNDHCMAISAATECLKRPEMMSELSKVYSGFVGKYATPDIELQLISFGTDASFDPNRVTCGTARIEGSRLKQPFSIKSVHGDWSDEYIAHIKESVDGSFRLEQIYYIDPFPEDNKENEAAFLPSL